jgi:hypothetical protein
MRAVLRYRRWFYILIVLAVWYALMFSPVGEYLAGFTIFGLIVVLYVCGCINVRRDGDR